MRIAYTSAFGGSAPRRSPAPGEQAPVMGQQFGTGAPAQRPAPQSAPQPMASNTFRALQSQGVARPPAPQAPMAQPAPRFAGSSQAGAVRNDLQASVQAALSNLSRYDAGTFRTLRDTAMADLDNQFGRARSSLETDLARRGLSASSIAANNLYDLSGQQARATAGLNADLLREAATTQAGDRLAAQQAASNLAALAGSQDMAAFDANRLASQADFTNALAAAQFGQGQREFDVQAALEAARAEQTGGQSAEDLALRRELGVGQLDLSRDELTQRFGAAEADRMMRQREIDQQAALTREGRTFEGMQNDLQRALQERLASSQLGLDRDRLAQTERLALGEQGLTREQMAQQSALTREGRTFEGMQNDMQRALQERLASSQLGLDRDRLAQTERLALGEQGLTREQMAQQAALTREGRTFESGQNDLQRQLQERLAQSELGFNRESLAQNATLAREGRVSNEQIGAAERALRMAEAQGMVGGRETVQSREANARIAQSANDELYRQLALLLQIPGGIDALRNRTTTPTTTPIPTGDGSGFGGGGVTGGVGFDGERFF